MMDLKTHLSTAPKGTAARYARELKVSPVMLSQWATRLKEIPVERCAELERVSAGAVMRWDSRPDDWHIHWPELKRDRRAPSLNGSLFTTTLVEGRDL